MQEQGGDRICEHVKDRLKERRRDNAIVFFQKMN
jgi:hypothetical protein